MIIAEYEIGGVRQTRAVRARGPRQARRVLVRWHGVGRRDVVVLAVRRAV